MKKGSDPIDTIRRGVELVAPVMHRPVTTGLHEAMVEIFVGRAPSTHGRFERPRKGAKAPRPAK